MIVNVYERNGKLNVKIPNYYLDARHKEEPYTDGLYGVLPKGLVNDFLSETPRRCGNWMEWAYNNPRQPVAEILPGQTSPSAFLDASYANAVRNLGSMKNIWKDFAQDCHLYDMSLENLDINLIEKSFWDYYITHYKANFDNSVKILEKYVTTRRQLMTESDRQKERMYAPHFANDEVWIAGCKDFLKHLVYTSPRGYIMELVLFAALRAKIGGEVEDSDINAERAGIDGYLVFLDEKIPISVKPSTYRRNDAVGPLYDECWVTYYKPNYKIQDLIFEFQTGSDKIINRLTF